MMKIFFCLLISLTFSVLKAQEEKLVQFSGLTITSDSLNAVPFVNIIIKGINRGTISDYRGFFSLVVDEGDTVIFSHLSFVQEAYIIPKGLDNDKYSVIQLLTQDTVFLAETIIHPWPTKEQFRQAFLSLNIPDDDLERAKKNLEREKLREIMETLPRDGKEIQKQYLAAQAAKYYYAGQTPPMNIFNPLAWAEFFAAWKRGDFRKK